MTDIANSGVLDQDKNGATRRNFLKTGALGSAAVMGTAALSSLGAQPAGAEPAGEGPVKPPKNPSALWPDVPAFVKPKSCLKLPKVYIASESGFSAQYYYWYNVVFLPWVCQYVNPQDPWDVTNTPTGSAPAWYRGGHADELLIRGSVATLAILNGATLDSGTTSEIGFSYALGHKIFALRQDFRNLQDEDAPFNEQTYYWVANSGKGYQEPNQGGYATTLDDLATLLENGLKNP